jgi:outer membrane protein assembly factor BamB
MLANGELPPEWKHGGSWNFIDLDRNGKLDKRDWSFYRSRRSASNVTIAVKPAGGAGDLTDSHVLWKFDRSAPQVSSPLLYGGLLYLVKDGGILTALDAVTGEVRKQARLQGALGNYYSSPIAAGGFLYIAAESGKVAVVKPGADWEVLAVNDLGQPIYATPAPADGELYIRTSEILYCFRELK